MIRLRHSVVEHNIYRGRLLLSELARIPRRGGSQGLLSLPVRLPTGLDR